MKPLSALVRTSCAGAVAAACLLIGTPAQAASPAQEALSEVQGDVVRKNVVQNRFFYKEKRFEIAPVIGLVPNNPMVARYTGGILAAYHLTESFGLGGQLLYSPDFQESDLKDLTLTLVQIAQGSDEGVEFQQPLDKMILGATFSANWSPVYGKINLVGETVLNFDLYGSAGLGMLAFNKYYARYDAAKEGTGEVPVSLSEPTPSYTVPFNLAIGLDIFLNQSVALKVDARNYFYIGDNPQYDPDVRTEGRRLYNNFIASAGVSIFIPKMNPRLSDF